VYRILTSYRAKGFIGFDPSIRRYTLGPRLVSLALGHLDRIDIRTHARSVLLELRQATNETVTLSTRSGWSRMYVDQVTPNRDVKMVVQVGATFPLHAGASSKAFLAFLDETEREQYLASQSVPKLTENTITNKSALRQEIQTSLILAMQNRLASETRAQVQLLHRYSGPTGGR
jgi:DNA-binding IclR family transcriptional regulator